MDERLSFSQHIKEKILKAMKGIALLKFLSKFVSKDILNRSHKLYVRPRLDYGDVIYHNQQMEIMNLVEQIQYKAALVVNRCWQGTSRGWEALSDRKWYGRLCMFYKIRDKLQSTCVIIYLHIERSTAICVTLKSINNLLQGPKDIVIAFFLIEWEKLCDEVKASTTVGQFTKYLVSNIRPPERSMYGSFDISGIKLLTKFRVEFSDLRSHRLSHNFNCASPICSCNLEEKVTVITSSAVLNSILSGSIFSKQHI